MTRFTIAQAEAVLAEFNQVAPDKRAAFSARLKNLQKQGLGREVSKPGQGRSATITFVGVIQMAFAVEMVRLGLPPQRAASISAAGWRKLLESIVMSVYSQTILDRKSEEKGKPLTSHWVWRVHYDALSEMADGENPIGDIQPVEAIRADEVNSVFAGIGIGTADKCAPILSAILINGTLIVRAIISIITKKFRYANTLQLLRNLELVIQREAYIGGEMLERGVKADEAENGALARSLLDELERVRTFSVKDAPNASISMAANLRQSMTDAQVAFCHNWLQGEPVDADDEALIQAAFELEKIGVFRISNEENMYGESRSLAVTKLGFILLSIIDGEASDVHPQA